MPQLPYLPLGDLRAVVSYPNEEGAVDDREIQQALIKVALPHLVIRLNDVGDWAKVLSVGEQQRIAFARILLTKPTAVFLDESTSALDEGLELTLYELLRAELPDIDSGQREPPRDRRAVPRPPAGARRRRRVAAGTADHRAVEALCSGLPRALVGVPCRNGNVHPDAGLGQRALGIAGVDRQGLGDRGGSHAGHPAS